MSSKRASSLSFALAQESAHLRDDPVDRLVGELWVDRQAQDLRGGALGDAEAGWTASEAAAIGRLPVDRHRIVDPGRDAGGPEAVAQRIPLGNPDYILVED